jgi:light-regulated signal transduction histidine kinase (bacteriophytochrome)
MSELLRALLHYSRAGTSQLNYAPTSLSEVVKEAASDLEHLLIRSRGNVEIGELPTVEADAALLRQLFQNLIENSIKYRKESVPPVVKIYGRTAGATCRISIEDNGIGFDECYCNRIFKPFERLHGRNAPYTGTGMGLAICRKIVTRQGGDITVNSIAGQGTTFIVALPAEQKSVG